jgi:hypothetical protein
VVVAVVGICGTKHKTDWGTTPTVRNARRVKPRNLGNHRAARCHSAAGFLARVIEKTKVGAERTSAGM